MLTGSHDGGLVVLSIIIAMLASYAALSFAGRVRATSGSTRFGWLSGGAIVMGLGIWSMHFVGMLAFSLPIPIGYDLALMLLSAAVAIAASLLALTVASRPTMGASTLLPAGLLLGGAIVSMHYVGMASIRTSAHLHHDPSLVAASIGIAIVASLVALALAFHFRTSGEAALTVQMAASAVVMGIAIAGMHYTAMAGAQFAFVATGSASGPSILATRQLGIAVALCSLAILALGLLGVAVDRRVLARRVALTHKLEMQTQLLAEQAAELMAQTETLEEHAVGQELLNNELLRANEQLEKSLAETKRAREAELEASAARIAFGNMASHELRTPLGAIGGYTDLLLMGLRGPLSEEQRKDLERVQVNQRHMLRLINDMLDLAKLEARQMSVSLGQLAVPALLKAAVPMIEPQLMAKSIRFSQHVDGPPLHVMGDAERVQQILINLLANSIKFTPPNGSIAVDARRVDSRVELRVHDSGIGISPDKRNTLFRPFSQLDQGEKGGTGLGLSISRELARAMGGDLSLDCDDCDGTTFVLSLLTGEKSEARESPAQS